LAGDLGNFIRAFEVIEIALRGDIALLPSWLWLFSVIAIRRDDVFPATLDVRQTGVLDID
jgi:hypothetical protein